MIRIQDTNFGDTYSFHEILISTFNKSIDGIGIFAFASSAGAKLIFNDPDIISYLSRNEYQLLVGTDSITDERSIEALNELSQDLEGLKVKAYLNEEQNLFHPKLSLFKSEDNSGSLLVGSNNLTIGGLRKNIEAFASIHLNEDEYERNKIYLESWFEQTSNRILDITDDRIIQRVKLNNYNTFTKPRAQNKQFSEDGSGVIPNENSISNEIIDGWTFNSNAAVLFAEIPKSGDRWKQANFDKSTFEDFFGATPGNNTQRILLRAINSNGVMGEIEVRPSVSVVSQNYRFELDAASGLTYPSMGKAPIGVFVRLTVRMFIYMLYMPTNSKYDEIHEWMRANWTGRADRKIRIVKPYQMVNTLLENTYFSRYLHKNNN